MQVFFNQVKSDRRGITLVEVIVSIGIFSFLVVAITALFLTSWKYNKIVWEQLKTQNEGRKVTRDFTNELRVASLSSIGAYPIESASSSQIVFYGNIDADTVKEKIRYFLSGRTLKRGVIEPSGSPLTYNSANEVIVDLAYDLVTSTVLFSYYSSGYTGAEAQLPSPVDVTQIRVVGISLTLEEDPNASPVPFYIESKVMLRNLKDN
ncbi:MAG: prepilin-type N-terminal cleavage/methylation domain-containing protein [Candidatus Magasanikbacteria bacterium]|nr:prepilin-type N-terminal cleavage/methylation domain-containing protein [Candidatus Magasanikbacteria bacterium]